MGRPANGEKVKKPRKDHRIFILITMLELGGEEGRKAQCLQDLNSPDQGWERGPQQESDPNPDTTRELPTTELIPEPCGPRKQ